MVGIVAVSRFCEAGGSAFSSYIDYIDRDEATRSQNAEQFDLFSNYLNYMGDEKKQSKEVEKTSNLFSKSSDSLDMNEKKALKEAFATAQKNGSNMWQTVISFDNSYLEKQGILNNDGLLNEKKLIGAGRKAIETMLSKENLSNAVWSGAIHYNTDNMHIHFAIVEPIPMREKNRYRQWEKTSEGRIKTKYNEATGKMEKVPRLDRKGNQLIEEKYKGRFKQSSIESLKSVMCSELEQNKDETIEINNLLRGIIKGKKATTLLDDIDFKDKVLEIYNEILDTKTERRYWNYNQNTLHSIMPKIDDLSNDFIKKYHRDDYDNLIAKITRKSADFATSYGGQNDYLNSKLHDRKDGLYSRLGNAILKELQSYDKHLQFQRKIVIDAENMLENGAVDEKLNAIKELHTYAEEGNTFAQNKLGLMYLKGEYVDKDMNKAKDYFSKSARNGNSFGEKMLEDLLSRKIKGGNTDHLVASKRAYRSGYASRDFNMALNSLKRSLEEQYTSWRNMQTYEEIQFEIEHRGQDIR